MRRFLSLVLLGIVLLGLTVFSNCTWTYAATPSPTPDSGNLDGSTYTNAYFGLSMTLPSDWQVHDQEYFQRLKERGKEVLAGNDQNMKNAFDAAPETNTINLFTITQYPIGSPVPYNANLTAIAENVSSFPGIQTGSDYLYNMQKLLKNSQLKCRFTKGIKPVTFDNQTFYFMEMSVKYGKTKVKQRAYVTVIKDHVILFAYSYILDEQLNSLTPILDSIRFSE